jgi:putative FmdB family regulatory protein
LRVPRGVAYTGLAMPIYEYRRPDGTTFELLQSFSDDALTTDPETGVPVQKVLHAPAIHFKGKGFHNTDYGTRKRNRELERSASEGADKTDAKAADKAADKPAAKADGASGSSSSSGSSSDGGGGASSNGAGGGGTAKADKPAAKKDRKAA